MLLAYSLLGGSALFLICRDVREQSIPLSGLIAFVVAALLRQGLKPDLEGLWAASAIAIIMLGCQGLFYLFTQAPAMGLGDLLLSPCCGLWLQFDELPVFFIFTGIFAFFMGIFWRYRWGMRTFPMIPGLLLGLASVFLIRCFLSPNGL